MIGRKRIGYDLLRMAISALLAPFIVIAGPFWVGILAPKPKFELAVYYASNIIAASLIVTVIMTLIVMVNNAIYETRKDKNENDNQVSTDHQKD